MAQKTPQAQHPNETPAPPEAPERPHVGRCSICKAPTEPTLHPFCSRRCADLDLARWLGGGYVIADAGLDGDEDDDQIVRPSGGNSSEDE